MRIEVTVRAGAIELTSAQMTLLSDAEVEQRLGATAGWQRGEGSEIVRDLSFPDFASAIAFVNSVADASEAANHHPDILLHGWNKVRLTLSTHSQGGLTAADFELARQIDDLA
jgi:4a-hydroxytetrahydrobiopterin dehydratase